MENHRDKLPTKSPMELKDNSIISVIMVQAHLLLFGPRKKTFIKVSQILHSMVLNLVSVYCSIWDCCRMRRLSLQIPEMDMQILLLLMLENMMRVRVPACQVLQPLTFICLINAESLFHWCYQSTSTSRRELSLKKLGKSGQFWRQISPFWLTRKSFD